MKKTARHILIMLTAALFPACNREEHRSSIPQAPVFIHVDVPTYYPVLNSLMANVCFTPDDINTDEQNLNKRIVHTGYAGVLVHSLPSTNNYAITYTAFDMACPNEADPEVRVRPDSTGVYAVCEECGSRFELEYGLAASKDNPSRENLRRHEAVRVGNMLTVRQRTIGD